MKLDNNRVLSRKNARELTIEESTVPKFEGARELTPQEALRVAGAYTIHTFTNCGADAHIGEC